MGVWNAKKKNNKIRRGEGHKNVVPHMLRAIDLPSATVIEEVRRAYPFLFFFFAYTSTDLCALSIFCFKIPQ